MRYFVDNKSNKELEQFAEDMYLSLTTDATFVYAKDKNIDIKSLIVLRKIFMIEPLISENHIATKKLLDLIFDYQESNKIIIRAFIKKEKLSLAEKLGFTHEFKDKIIIERIPQCYGHQNQKEKKQ